MKKHIIAFAGLLAGALMSVSCSQDLLDFEQHGVMEVDKTYAEADDQTAQQLIANVYVRVKYLMMGDWGVHYIATTTAKTADCWPGGSGPNDGVDYLRMAMMVDDEENSAYKEMYSRLYQIIYKCNMIVDKLNDGSDERRRVIGEAKAWRAWAMARLTQLWGSAPLVDHVLDGINYSFYPGNSDPEKNWEWIMRQFDEAAEVLPSKSGLGGQRAIGGRWTAEACYAYKAQGYMWRGDYANAKTELAKVINSGKYDLWTGTATMGPSSYGQNMQLNKSKNAATWKDGSDDYEYLTLYRAEADFCDEFLLEIDIDGDATTIENTEPYWFRAYMNWRYDEINKPGNLTPQDGWGFITPTRSFAMAFARHDGNSIRRRANIATYSEVYHDFPYENVDVRGVMSSMLYGNEGYFRMKYYDFLDDAEPTRYASGNTKGNMTNFPLMRYADVLLMYAEACCLSGEGTANISGLEALNKVRRRAGLTDAPALDMDNDEYGIKAERRFELWLDDCDRYVDLIRWGDYKDFITTTDESLSDAGHGVGPHWAVDCAWLVGLKDPSVRTDDPTDLSNYEVRYDPQSTRGTWSDRLYLWPFPYAELTQNPNLVQNAGW